MKTDLMWEPTKIQRNSFLILSNDRRRVYLVDQYREDGSREHCNRWGRSKPVTGKFWRICKPVDPDKLITERDKVGRVLTLGVFPNEMYDPSRVQWEAVREMLKKKEAFELLAQAFERQRRLTR